ncbi:hypothetical protein F511_12796, partial [Dorcoceras hygrometricum]
KLSDDNYLLWHLQVLAGIRGLGLEPFIHQNPLVPPQIFLLYILVYVDDILITGSNGSQIQDPICQLNKQFSLKDLGDLSYFVGIEVFRSPVSSLFLTQTKYTRDLLLRTNMMAAKSLPTPMFPGLKLSSQGTDFFEHVTLYRSTVGALQYLTITRPDIAYSVNKVCQFMQRPLQSHWTAVKRILRYLCGTLDFGISLGNSPSLNLYGYCDADLGSDPDDHCSTSGFCWFFGNSPVLGAPRNNLWSLVAVLKQNIGALPMLYPICYGFVLC